MEPLAGDDPRALGGYRLLGRLGAGGMGRVYLGRSAGGRTVAVKVVHAHFAADDQFRARFRREIESARRVGGAWTAPVLDADPEAAAPWIATGYVAGPSLSQAVSEVGPLAEHSVRALGAGLAEALAAVHALGLVHRDVKPSNVLLTLDGPVLIDFGIARATEGTASLTSTGVSIGSPGYMAPEQILGKGTAGAADVFSLGAVLAFAATGAGPFSGDSSAALLYKVVHEEPELGPELDGELHELVVACLTKSPADRPAPEVLAARLAEERGGGAAELVRAGWLPGVLVERVSRQAVELLNLDAGEGAEQGGAARAPLGGAFGPPDPSYEATQPSAGAGNGAYGAGAAGRVAEAPGYGAGAARTGPAHPGPSHPGPSRPGPSSEAPPQEAVSGLVPFDAQVQGPAVTGPGIAGAGGTDGGAAGQAPGAAGPAIPAQQPGPSPSSQLLPHVLDSARTGGSPMRRGDPHPAPWPVAGASSGGPAPAPGGPGAGASGPALADLPTGAPAPKERRIALTGAVGGKDRPRRVSCSLVLSVAGALAAATTAAFVFQLLPGRGGADNAAEGPPSGSRPTPGAAPENGDTRAEAAVAKGFLGAWKGSVRTRSGIPNGTMTSVIKPGGKGDYVIHTTYDAVLVVCEAKAKLVRSTATRLVLTERADGKQGPGCTGNQSTVTYTLRKDGKIGFTSDDDAGGTPKATLTKSD
ncbi:serine/threonine-protein kinase [Streptomyces halobius]|uniref:Protein kinase n=1 Tax=Streptomyces halobius TaxID=2879846 RepID=A0ABY4ME08_9ACTN|nr:serine/threonine-protein kinase [Streptomyces halobius]UQA94630.1 protein kinase [Streptomyces halobius]